jgi:dipeptidase E
MKKLILTSNGVSSKLVESSFLELINGEVKDKRVLVLRSTRKDPDEYGFEILEELKNIGFNERNIRFVNPFKEVASKDMKEYDVIYSAGGNTFVITDSIKKRGFDSLIKDMVNSGVVYLGVSAGTIMMGPSIEIAGIGKGGDPNYINLEDLEGMGVTKITAFPHYDDENEEDILEFEKEKKLSVERIKDGECILVKGDVIEFKRL